MINFFPRKTLKLSKGVGQQRSSASIVLSEENITYLYNFVCTSTFACSANCKSEGQINGKLSYVKSRQHALQKMLYGIAALDTQT